MKIRLYVVSLWPSQAISYISRFAQSFIRTHASPVEKRGAYIEELHNSNSNVDEHEYVMNYR